MERLDNLLRAMDVKETSPEKFLEADLGLDFQERQCIREDIEERLQVVITDNDIELDLTMLEFAGMLSRKLLITPPQENFDGKSVDDIVISAPFARVSQSILNVKAWPGLLPHVHEVSLTYDDGLYQEFVIEMDNGDGKSARDRMVRRCEPDHIAYFHPEPACFLKHHCGDWFVRALAHNATHLTIVQRWSVSAKGEARFPACDGIGPAQAMAIRLRKYARFTLAAWKRALEHPAP